jgi:hypothetical protein
VVRYTFPFQGFYIRSHNEVSDLKAFCELFTSTSKREQIAGLATQRFQNHRHFLERHNPQQVARGRIKPFVVKHDYCKALKPMKMNSNHNLLVDLNGAIEETSFNLVGKGLNIKKPNKSPLK